MSEHAVDHPITLEAAGAPVRVSVGGQEVARSERAVILREKGYDPVFYVPRADVRMDLLETSDTRTHCPFKGDASYFAMNGEDVAWSYADPLPGVGGIAGHLAFYPDKAAVTSL